MSQLTQFKKTRFLSLLIPLSLAVAAVLTARPALATPGSQDPAFHTEYISIGRFADFEIFAKTLIDPTPPKHFWFTELEAHPDSDLYVVRNTFQPGAHTGWHTHPGPSFITVTAGTITAYEGNDPSCSTHVYPTGSTFFDKGGKHVHLLRKRGH